MNYSFNKTQFSLFLSGSLKFKTPSIIFYYNVSFKKQIGFIVSKKFGSATKRNLFKRRFRFLYLKNFDINNFHTSLIVKPLNFKMSYSDIKNSYFLFLKKLVPK